jgi:hypothetical protein
LEWLFRSDFDGITTIALWSIAAVIVTTVVLFVYTMGLRFATVRGEKRRHRFLEAWREVFATAAINEHAALEAPLPALGRSDHTHLLEEWNRARSVVEGKAADNLIALARRADIPDMAARMMKRRRVQSQIMAVQTFGHLRDQQRFEVIRPLLNHPNTALSITAATSLVEIDPVTSIALVVPLIHERRDWPKNKVSILLREAGSELISEPMFRAIRSARNEDKTYLLQFARLIDSEVKDALVEDLIRESDDPGVLNAALRLISGFRGVPRIAALTQHAAWFVRMQAAKVLGRVGQQEHLALLESLLGDPEWWVRYRAAQSIASLPFLGPNQLRQLRHRQKDRYAADIMQQTLAEVGLA